MTSAVRRPRSLVRARASVSRLVDRVRGPDHAGLAGRVRWLFLLFLLLILAIVLLALPSDAAPAFPNRVVAALGTLAWAFWGLARYRRPAAPLVLDLVPLATLVVVGATTASAGSVFGPSFATIFVRSTYGTRRAAAISALVLGAVYEVLIAAREGVGAVAGAGGVLLLVAYPAIALLMHALTGAARRHEDAARLERTLAGVTADLLRARTVAGVHAVAVEGALALTGGDGHSASLWLRRDDFELAASAGPTPDASTMAASRGGLSAEHVARLTAGHPALVEGDDARALQELHATIPTWRAMLIGPVLRDDDVDAVLVLTSLESFAPDLVDVVERFTHEISLAIERAELIERLHRLNRDLVEASELKDRFLSVVSHELRTPLTNIRGFVETLLGQGEQLPPEARRRFLEIIARQAVRQQHLVDQLLLTSQIISGQHVAHRRRVPLAPLLATALEDLGADGEWQVTCPADVAVHADAEHLHQMVSNLVTNARKYGRAPFTIDVTTSGDTCTIRFADDGDGVPADFLPHLFDAFTQADTGTTRTATGVGLGLAIVQGLVAANGGEIRYVADGPGACFEIDLALTPTVTAAPTPPRAERTTPADGHAAPRGRSRRSRSRSPRPTSG